MIVSSVWAALGLEATRDVGAIRRAYAARLKVVHPEDDPEGFRDLRTAYEQAMALAKAEAWTPSVAVLDRDGEMDPDAPRGGGGRGSPEAAADTAPEVERLSPAPESPLAAYERAWARLEGLVAARDEPEPHAVASALQTILGDPVLEDIGAFLSAEARLAILIARNAPRTDALIDAAEARFEWSVASQERNANPAVIAVMRRRVHALHFKALEALASLTKRPVTPTETELYQALNAVTTKALGDHELFLHTESELCRLILEQAPRLDNLIGDIAGRLFWERRYYDERVPQVLKRRETAMVLHRLRSRSHPLSAAFRALQKPPGKAEVLRAAVSPKRHGNIRKLLHLLETTQPDILAEIPRDALAGWRRYHSLVKVNPFTIAVVTTVLLLFAGCQFLAASQHAADVARYYPARALQHRIGGHVLLRCGAGYDNILRGCVVAEEQPSGQGFAESAVRISRTGRMIRAYDSGTAPEYLFEARIDFFPPSATDGAAIQIGEGKAVASSPEDVPLIPSRGGAWRQDAPGRLKLVSGHVTLRCLRGPTGKLNQCAAIGEDPPGKGLGEYALLLAGDGVIHPAVGARLDAGGWIEFEAPVRFEQSVEVPQQPVPFKVVSGKVLLECDRSARGALSHCKALSESPRARGLGAYALAEARAGHIRLDKPDPIVEGKIRINFRIRQHLVPIRALPSAPPVLAPQGGRVHPSG